jgi:hypothetical protein
MNMQIAGGRCEVLTAVYVRGRGITHPLGFWFVTCLLFHLILRRVVTSYREFNYMVLGMYHIYSNETNTCFEIVQFSKKN